MRPSRLLLAFLTTLVAVRCTAQHPDIRVVLDIEGVQPGPGWFDSYSIGNNCYCDTTYDHNIGIFHVETPLGWMTVKEVCELLGPGPGRAGRPVYNDIQCGNGPPNDAGDEHSCPGRTDIGIQGCGHIGPRWNFEVPGETVAKVSFGSGAVDGYLEAEAGLMIGDPFSFNGVGMDIGGTSSNQAYASHIWSFNDFGYRVPVNPDGQYIVRIGLAESYGNACRDNGRVFDLFIGENKSKIGVNAFELAGNKCAFAHDLVFRNVVPDASGNLVIMARKGDAENPFLALLEVSNEDENWEPEETPSPTPEPTPSPTPGIDNSPDSVPLKISFGGGSVSGYSAPKEGKLLGTNIEMFSEEEDIKGTNNDNAYSSHMYSFNGVVGYRLKVDPSKRYQVKVGLAESYTGNCFEDRRIFQLKVGNKSETDIDVFSRVGCKTADNIFFLDVSPSQNGELRIEALAGGVDNPMMSLIEVSEEAPSGEYRSLPLKISFGSDDPTNGYDVVDQSRLSGTTNPSKGNGESILNTSSDAAYRSNLWSIERIAYAVDKLNPNGRYNVMLGFAETYLSNCKTGMRMFDVQVGTIFQRDVDVFEGAGRRCLSAFNLYFYNVEPMDGLIPIIIRKGSVDNPFISLLEVTPA